MMSLLNVAWSWSEFFENRNVGGEGSQEVLEQVFSIISIVMWVALGIVGAVCNNSHPLKAHGICVTPSGIISGAFSNEVHPENIDDIDVTLIDKTGAFFNEVHPENVPDIYVTLSGIFTPFRLHPSCIMMATAPFSIAFSTY